MKNQIEQAEFIKQEFSKYIRSAFDIRDDVYRKLFYEKLDAFQSKLYKGPYLASMLPFQLSLSNEEMVEKGEMNDGMLKLGTGDPEDTNGYIDPSRSNYVHQIKCFKQINRGHSVVVTTGTGSGKTESFMYPIINSILEEKAKCKAEGKAYKSGVRAIFLFPMNALVYDQMDRLRSMLKRLDIRFGFYVGYTPHNEKDDKYARYISKFGKPDDIEKEPITRDQMRDNPPDILFTNYSMLEYLLIRPADKAIISKEALENWRFIVLDEAHTYKGALGIEISLLLRRLAGIANNKPQYILTSATLGRGKEDLPKIIDFANKLTSSAINFTEDDIIFGDRHQLPFDEGSYYIRPSDYVYLLENLSDPNKAEHIFAKYGVDYNKALSIDQNLYELLSKDGHTIFLYKLSKGVIEFAKALEKMPQFDVDSLTALIELINKASCKDHKYKLFDIKYHFFVKAPDGAFITLGNNCDKKLSLVSCNYIDGRKAFKIGICTNCKMPYIMGITSPEGILSIDDEIDIDEPYQDKIKRLEYYLIADCMTKEEIEDVESNKAFTKFLICSKCGKIKKFNSQYTKDDCKCGAENYVVLYKYTEKEDKIDKKEDNAATNNLHKCPICDYKSNSGAGVIAGFHIGKDRATSLISQILYQSMEYPQEFIPGKKTGLVKTPDTYKKLRKQFLTFSDSRQQAAFFSKFLNSNNDRFLKKAMMLHILKENNYEPLSYVQSVNKLNTVFRNELGYPEAMADKHSKVAALWELLLVDGRNSGEGIGLFAYMLDFKGHHDKDDVNPHFFNQSDEEIEAALASEGYSNISAQQFRDIVSVVLNVFRTAPAIEYESFIVDDEDEKDELLGYRQFKNFVSYQESSKDDKSIEEEEEIDEETEDDSDDDDDKKERNNIRSFLPVVNATTKKSSTNGAVRYICKALGYTKEKAKELLTAIWDVCVNDHILIPAKDSDQPDRLFEIHSDEYCLHSYKKLKFYRCPKCGKVTLYNVNGACTEPDCSCDGKTIRLEEITDIDSVLGNNYYREQYLKKPLESVDCEEHTAQLKADEARQIQEDFKDGKINIISCSTTFEMGIDLGKLNTVFMRNVPPTPANYAQRAGRAGRRSDTSAFILTFCSLSSHDFTYFQDPKEMVRGLVRPPYFTIDNDKIILRHITASALSYYFRLDEKHSEDFCDVDAFLSKKVIDHFISFINSKPQGLGEYIDNYVLETQDLLDKYGDFKWIDYLSEAESSLVNMSKGLEETIKLYNETMEYEKSLNHFKAADECKEALERFKSKNSLITYFSKYNVIPSYGFPVDTVELFIFDYKNHTMDDDYNLSRNLSVALSEYAPGSEVIVKGKKFTSRYLHKPHNGKALPKTYYVECPCCKQKNLRLVNNFVDGQKCDYCESNLIVDGMHPVRSFVTPIYGFVADRHNKKTRRMKPAKTYASDIYYVGKPGAVSKEDINIENVISIQEFNDEELLVLNENYFFTCEECGYTVLLKSSDKFKPKHTKKHKDFRGEKCGNTKGDLDPIHLGYTYRTDIIKFCINGIAVPEMKDDETALSVLYAILEGISATYKIERDDIGGIIFRTNDTKPYDLILFDTVSGGAGHVKRLKDSASLMEVLQRALIKVSVCECHEDTSCYNCLRTYGNQKIHKHLIRGKAKKAIFNIIDKILSAHSDYDFYGSDTYHFNSKADIDAFISNEILDEDDNLLFKDLISQLIDRGVKVPDGSWITIKTPSGSDSCHADFYWFAKRVLLFTTSQYADYEHLSTSQKKFKCYLLNNNLDIDDLIKQLED